MMHLVLLSIQNKFKIRKLRLKDYYKFFIKIKYPCKLRIFLQKFMSKLSMKIIKQFNIALIWVN